MIGNAARSLAIQFFSIIWVKELDKFYCQVQVGIILVLVWGGTGRGEEFSASFVDLVNISDLNYLAKNKVKDKEQGSFRLQVSNLRSLSTFLCSQTLVFLFVLVNSRNCVGVLLALSQ